MALRYLLISAMSFLFFAFSCDGELPPYSDPSDVLRGHWDSFYALSVSTNTLRIYVVVENTFDETLQGSATIGGQLVVTSGRDPNIRRTFTLTESNIIYARSYNAATRILTIDPGDSVKMETIWNFVDDNGTNLTLDFFHYQNDPACSNRRIALPELFSLSGELKVFDRLKSVRPRLKQILVCHVNAYVAPNFCPPVGPCSQ
ncbi:MAG: hypothetical protein HY562_10570 [Ignavibacteriales bacterium]|nr:hypothetical protein [Ignavibacteriales bacterium]